MFHKSWYIYKYQEMNIVINILFSEPQLVGGRPIGFVQSIAKEFNLEHPRISPVSSGVEGLNQEPLDYKNCTLTIQPHCLPPTLSSKEEVM